MSVVPIFFEPRAWGEGTLANGYPAMFPEKFRPEIQTDGSRLLIDVDGNIIAKMPEGGPCYEPVYAPLADATSASDVDKRIDYIVNYDIPSHLDKSFEELAEKAKAPTMHW